MNCSTLGLPVHHQLPESTQTHVHWVGDAIQPSHPLSSPSPPILNLSQHHDLFQWISSLHQVAKVLEFQLQHQSFQWTPGLIPFRMDWLDLLAVQGTVKSLLQHHSSKASILWLSAFFIVQLSHLYMTTGKTIAFYLWGLYKCLQFYLLLKSKLWLKHIVQLIDVRRLSWVGMLQPPWNNYVNKPSAVFPFSIIWIGTTDKAQEFSKHNRSFLQVILGVSSRSFTVNSHEVFCQKAEEGEWEG